MSTTRISRDPKSTAGAAFDLAVIGGGAYGAALALEATRRGLRTLLLEQADFCSGTTWNSLRIVHGGLRYLQSMDLQRFRESVGERTWFLQNFPDLVLPKGCLMPLYNVGVRRRDVFQLAVAVNDWLSRRRNAGVRRDRVIPDARVLPAAETAAVSSLIDSSGLKGGSLWYDAVVPDVQRLIMEMLRWAVTGGASCFNYLRATELLTHGQKVIGVVGTDQLSGETYEFRAAHVVNCAGPWCREVAASFHRDVPELFPFLVAFNLLLRRRLDCDYALALTSKQKGAQTFFLYGWKGMTLAGTGYLAGGQTRRDCKVAQQAVLDFLDNLNRAAPGLDLQPSEVARVHWGLLPAARPGSDQASRRPVLFDHGAAGGPHGLYTVSGVKQTTARLVAERMLQKIHAGQNKPLPPSSGPPRPSPGDWISAPEFQQLLQQHPDEAANLVRRICQQESVVHLDDLLLRRTDWGMDPLVGKEIGGRVSSFLDWDPKRTAEEVGRLKSHDLAWRLA